MYQLSCRNCVTKFLAFLLFLCARQRKDQCLRPPFAKDVAKCGLFCFARLSGSIHQFLGRMIAERVQNFLDLCLHVTQCFDYWLSHHNGIVWPSVTAFTSACISASVSSCVDVHIAQFSAKKYGVRFSKRLNQSGRQCLGLHIFECGAKCPTVRNIKGFRHLSTSASASKSFTLSASVSFCTYCSISVSGLGDCLNLHFFKCVASSHCFLRF